MKKKSYKYSVSFPEEMGEWVELQLERYPKRSISKLVQDFLEPAYLPWRMERMKQRIKETRAGK